MNSSTEGTESAQRNRVTSDRRTPDESFKAPWLDESAFNVMRRTKGIVRHVHGHVLQNGMRAPSKPAKTNAMLNRLVSSSEQPVRSVRP